MQSAVRELDRNTADQGVKVDDVATEAGGDPSTSLDETAHERLLSQRPLVVRRRVRWGECDPAGVDYTPRFTEYLAAAYAWFQRSILFGDVKADDPNRIATPMKALALEFHHVLRPDELFDMIVHVEAVRTRTFDLRIVGQHHPEPLGSLGDCHPLW